MSDALRKIWAYKNDERGIALVAVLWIGLLVASIAAAFVADTRLSTQLTRNFIDNSRARVLADGGVQTAIFHLIKSDIDQRWRRDRYTYRVPVASGKLEIMIEDEAGKVDLNSDNPVLLRGLLEQAAIETDKARTIVDYILEIRSGGAQQRENRSTLAPLPEKAGRAFAAIDALGQVPGVTPSLYRRLLPSITVYGAEETLTIRTSPAAVLRALPGITEDSVDKFLMARRTGDTEAALLAFLAEGDAENYYQEDPGDYVSIFVRAESNEGARFTRHAIVEIAEDNVPPFQILEWREDRAWPNSSSHIGEMAQDAGEHQ